MLQPERNEAFRRIRKIATIDLDEFVDVANQAPEQGRRVYWKSKLREMRMNFTEGFFSLPNEVQSSLWDWAGVQEED